MLNLLVMVAVNSLPGDAYTWPLRSPRTARVVRGGVLGELVAASVTGGVVGGGALSEALVARVFALWQRPGWLFQGGQRALARGVVEFLAVVAGEAGVVSLVGHDSEQGGVQHVPRCGGARVVLAEDAVVLQPARTPVLVPFPHHEAHICHHVPGALRVLLSNNCHVCGEA